MTPFVVKGVYTLLSDTRLLKNKEHRTMVIQNTVTILFLPKTDIFPSEIVHTSTTYSDVWILDCSDNIKTHHRQPFGVERY